MKSTLINKEENEIKYPCLMATHSSYGSKVVLFTNKGFGMVVYSEGDQLPIGFYSEAWDISGFTPFDGKLELSND